MEPIIGSIMVFAGNFAPKNWATCDGQLIPIQSNTALFSILGTTYGGDGKTNFALPDLRGRASNSFGQGPGLSDYAQGEAYGTETNTITINEMAAHNHGVSGSVGMGANSSAAANSNTPVGNYITATPSVSTYSGSGGNKMGPSPATVTIGETGSGVAFNNFQPSLAINYCIALAGIFPQRP